jgi:hypothetical protein
MKGLKKICLLCLTISLVIGSFYSWGWAQSDPIKDEWNTLDLMLARPIGVAAAIVGVGIFCASLPFTLAVDIISRVSGSPTSAVHDSAKMLMLEPLKFSFVREFPDKNM